MPSNEMWAPPGTVHASETRYYDQKTLRPLFKKNVVAAWVIEYAGDHGGEWPMIKQIMRELDVTQGTASRGRRMAQVRYQVVKAIR